jgi:hypothetical protein
MNKYLFAECPQDYWPEIKTIMAKSYNDAVEKLINKYGIELDDDKILNFDDFEDFREYLNINYSIALSDLEIYEEI